MYPHRIRLRGPWEYEPLAGPAAGTARRLSLPDRWADIDLGPARLTRAFGYPGRIDAHEHVWLTIEGLTVPATITLNGQPVGDATVGSFARVISSLLGPRNRLEIRVPASGAGPALWREVALEIRRDAYLSNVRVERLPEGTANVTGQVIGNAPRVLDLYVLLDGRSAFYQTIEPRPEGRPFSVGLKEIGSAAAVVRVELIDVSTVWYVTEAVIAALE